MTFKHGTASGYNKNKCRCIKCKNYQIERRKRYTQRLRELFKSDPESFKHGEEKTYVAGCRCVLCTKIKTTATNKSRAKAITKETPQDKHGTNVGYKYYGCRCEKCCESTYQQTKNQKDNYRQKRKELFKTNPELFDHGKVSTYEAGCRCNSCKKYVRELRFKRIGKMG